MLRPKVVPRQSIENVGGVSKIVNAYCETAFVNARESQLRKSLEVASQLSYQVRGRQLQAYLGGLQVLQHPTVQKPRVLLIGYDRESYDAQFLKSLGYEPNVVFLDVRDRVPGDVVSEEQFHKFEFVQADARDLESAIGSTKFDLIYLSRASVDQFDVSDTLNVLAQCVRALRDTRATVIAHLQTLFLTRSILESIDSGGQPSASGEKWASSLGEFPFSRHRLALDPSTIVYGDSLLSKICYDFLRKYSDRIHSPWLSHALKSPAVDAVREILLAYAPGDERLVGLKDLPGSASMIGTYLDSSPETNKGALYISSIVAIGA